MGSSKASGSETRWPLLRVLQLAILFQSILTNVSSEVAEAFLQISELNPMPWSELPDYISYVQYL